MINHGNHSEGNNVKQMIISECHKRFPIFKPQQPKKKRSKKEIDPVTNRPKIITYVQPAKVVNRILIPPERVTCLHHFIKWYYDNHTGEAVLCKDGTPLNDIRILDTMDMFSFSIPDLEVLFKNNIRRGAEAIDKSHSRGIQCYDDSSDDLINKSAIDQLLLIESIEI
ncbi:hypothetical protein L1987_01672 [Smallanthus sonchifolius]|uniref:Uncharacterized protein n=1 Tax=Smallanthus sonchifolius TaxID=185202 RepID=A0ACB9K5P5_9ASTR|nr:hypothetical protein L1987_01672 [Smallanthus sonchifolius]